MPTDPHRPDDAHDRAHEDALRRVLDRVAHRSPVADGWMAIAERLDEPDPDRGATTMTAPETIHPARRHLPLVVAAATIAAVLALVAGVTALNRGDDADDDISAATAAPDPLRGGTLRYGADGLTDTGLCLPSIDGSPDVDQIARAFFDPLLVIDDRGEPVPHLAESLTPDPNATTWELIAREGIVFHDGTPLDGDALKANLDAYRGTNPAVASLGWSFALDEISDVTVSGPRSVTITTTEAWPSLPHTLAAGMAMLAPAQLDPPPPSDPAGLQETCVDVAPIGTGPFRVVGWGEGDAITGERNPSYWQDAPDGEPYPLADAIEFVPVDDGEDDLARGRIDAWRSPRAASAAETSGSTSPRSSQVAMIRLNHASAPFDDPTMRRALALALDRPAVADRRGGAIVVADGPFAPGIAGHLDDAGFPAPDVDEAATLVDAHVAGGGSAAFELLVMEPRDSAAAALLADQAEAVGFEVTVTEVDVTEAMSRMILDTYQAAVDRTLPLSHPDQARIWWSAADGASTFGPNQLNLGNIDDPDLDELFRQGRRSDATTTYEDVTRHLNHGVHAIWLWHEPWSVATTPDLGDVLGPDLPGGARPSSDLSRPHSLLSLAPGA